MHTLLLLMVVGATILSTGCSTTSPCAVESAVSPPAKSWQRIAFVGHSFTDGGTWPYLLRQALVEAGHGEPYLINAAVNGMLATGARPQFDRTVLRFNPDLVIFFIGINAANQDAFRPAMEEMIAKSRDQGADVILVTHLMFAPDDMGPADMTDPYKVAHALAHQRAGGTTATTWIAAAGEEVDQRELAPLYGAIICEGKPAMMHAFEQGHWLWDGDRVHLNFGGNRAIARAVLDSMGHRDVPVPTMPDIRVLPGLVTTWQLRPAAAGEPALTEAAVADLLKNFMPDGGGWTTYTLPEAPRTPVSWWDEQLRREGYATRLEQTMGRAERYIGVATYRASEAGTVFINTGAGLRAVWFNGREVFRVGGWEGFHIGARRVEVDVVAGDNTIVIETGGQFALTVTPGLLW